MNNVISLDTETTGIDVHHGAKPYIVTMCFSSGSQLLWQWYVDPKTREPIIEDGDLEEIQEHIANADQIILQNAKFDISVLKTVIPDLQWDWSKTHDTLVAAHVLASNERKDLTTLGIKYLGRDIEYYEKATEKNTKECLRLVRKLHPSWMIAREGLACMPSARKSNNNKEEKLWKYDMWVMRAYAKEHKYLHSHPYYTSVGEYANKDSETTLALWLGCTDKIKKKRYSGMREILEQRGLWNHYLFRMDSIRIAHDMERRGLTFSKKRTHDIGPAYVKRSKKIVCECVSIAEKLDYDLDMPKGKINKSLTNFLSNTLNLEPFYNKKSKTGKRTFNKDAIAHYLNTLSSGSTELQFIKLMDERAKYDNSISQSKGYLRYAKLISDDTYLLHPNVNPVGTDTLRWSHRNPNSGNISKRKDAQGKSLRYMFGPAEGREWWSLDARNIELRIPFYTSGEQSMIDLFEKPDEPPFYGSNHMLMFSVLWPELWADAINKVGIKHAAEYCKTEYKDTYYQWTKNFDFACQYGSGRENADKTAHRQGAYDLSLQMFSKLAALNSKWVNFANKHGYVETLPDRTIDPHKGYPLLCTRSEYGKILTTVPLSYHVSGSAMQLEARAMTEVDRQLSEWRKHDNFDAYICCQVHDEILIDVPKRANPKENPRQSNLGRMRVIQRTMERCGEDFVPSLPTPFSLGYHESNWSKEISF